MRLSVRNVIAWILQILLAIFFIRSGYSKLSNLPMSTKFFSGMGLPGWFAYLIGGAELLGGIGLLIPQTVRLAAAGLVIIMIGALAMHATRLPGGIGGGTFAAAMLLGLVVVLVLRRPVRRLLA